MFNQFIEFVGFIEFMTKVRTRSVKDHTEIFRFVLTQNLEKHLGKTVNRLSGHAFAVGQLGQGVESSIDVRASIDNVEGFFLVHEIAPEEPSLSGMGS